MENQLADLYSSVENSSTIKEWSGGIWNGRAIRKYRVVDYKGFKYFLKYNHINLFQDTTSEYRYAKILESENTIKCFGIYVIQDWSVLILEYLDAPWINLVEAKGIPISVKTKILKDIESLRVIMLDRGIISLNVRGGNVDDPWHDDLLLIDKNDFWHNASELGCRKYNGPRVKIDLNIRNFMFNPMTNQIKLIDLQECEYDYGSTFEFLRQDVSAL